MLSGKSKIVKDLGLGEVAEGGREEGSRMLSAGFLQH